MEKEVQMRTETATGEEPHHKNAKQRQEAHTDTTCVCRSHLDFGSHVLRVTVVRRVLRLVPGVLRALGYPVKPRRKKESVP